jgi:lysophospholipase L1-like esterase
MAYKDTVSPSSTSQGVDITQVSSISNISTSLGVYQLPDGTLYSVNSSGNKFRLIITTLRNVLFFGTSITAKYTTNATFQTSSPGSDSYVVWAAQAMSQSLNKIIDKGVSGNTTTQMLARYAADVTANLANFDVLVFEPGPNDAGGSNIGEYAMKSNYVQIIETTLAAGKTVIVITPTNTLTPPQSYRTNVINWLIPYIANLQSLGYQIALINTDSFMTLSDLSDGVHPNITGAQKLGYAVASQGLANFCSNATYNIPHNDIYSHKQYMDNPYLIGNNASGTNYFFALTGVTGTGANMIAVGKNSLQSGTFTYLSVNGNTVNAVGLSGTPAFTVVIGGMNGAENLTGYVQATHQQRPWAFPLVWPGTGGTCRIGDKFQSASALANGGWRVTVPGILGTQPTAPNPSASTAYGETFTSGTASLVWQKVPSAGDIFQAEIKYSVVATGNWCVGATASFNRSNENTLAETHAQKGFPFLDTNNSLIYGSAGGSQLSSGILRSDQFTLVDPGGAIAVWNAQIHIQVLLAANTNMQLTINEVNLVKIN